MADNFSAQTEEAFKQPKKGLSYGELIIDNILGLDNEYESFGEKLGKAINEDEINFLKNAAVGVYEGAKEFVTSPVETTKKVVTDIKNSVQRLGTEDLDTRLKNMYGISYNEATNEQVNKAREAVFGDALTALELIPAAKGATAVAKAGSAAIPSGIKADVVGQTKALLSGDTEFLKGTPTERSATQSLSAGFTGQNPPTYIPKGESIFLDAIPRDNTSMLRFREPIAEFTRKLTMTNSFPSKGMTGAEFLSLLEKNAESIPPSSYKEGLVDRDKRYTKEELLHAVTIGSENFLPQSLYYNIADLNAPPKFGTYQRQTEVGFTGYPRYPEDTSYFSIPILSRTVGNTFKANYQHFNPNTTAHVRGSFIDPLVGFEVNKTLSPEFKSIIGKDQPYLLVEEIQSDLLQKGYRKPKNSFDTAFDKAANEAMIGTQTTFQEVYGDVTNELKSLIKTLEAKNIVMPEEPVRLQLPFRTGVLNHPVYKERRRRDFLDELRAPERGVVDGSNLVNFEEVKDYIDKQGVNSSHIYQILNDIELSASATRSFNPFESVSFVGPNGKVYNDIIVRSQDSNVVNNKLAPYTIDQDSPAYSQFLTDFEDYTKQFGLSYEDLLDKYEDEITKYYDAIDVEIEAKNLDTDLDRSFITSIYDRFLEIKKDQKLLGDETNTALPPVRKNKQTVEEALKVLIAKADQEGVDKIVIPPASKIAEARGRTIDPSDKGDRFYRTYVTDLDKALKDLEKNYPVTIHRDVELPYKSEIFKLEGTNKRVLNVTNKGTIIDISKLREQFQVDKPRQFAEGGAVNNMSMKQQMSLFEYGGIADDGMTKDPVSGNNIPPGSLAKEVRDDIPAMLSEGEYVIPADVLRYYGVNFFENLRNKAKSGLQNMEQNGRIGGTPMTQQDVARNMQQPMMVPAPVQAAQGTMMQSPIRIQQQAAPQAMGNSGMQQQPVMANQGTMVQGFNQGPMPTAAQYRSSWSPAKARYSSPMFQGTSSQQANVAAAAEAAQAEEITQFRTHYNQAGETAQVKYVGTTQENMRIAEGQDDIIAKYPLTEAEYQAYKKEMNNRSDKGGRDPDPTPTGSDTSWMDGIDWNDPQSVKDWVESDDGLGMSSLARGIAGTGGTIGAIPQGVQANDIAKARGIRDYYDFIGDKEMVDYLDGKINEAMKNPGLLTSALDKLGLMTGNYYLQQLKDLDPVIPGNVPGFQARVARQKAKVAEGAEAQKAADEAAAAAALKAAQSNQDDDDDPFAVTDVSIDRDPMGQGTMTTTYKGIDPGLTTASFEEDPDIDFGVNKGGLMAAPKPKKKTRNYNKGGLAGKK